VTIDQPRQHCSVSQIDLLRTGGNLDAPGWPRVSDTITSNDYLLVARQRVRRTGEQSPGVNHHRYLVFGSQAGAGQCKDE
jgi:hypothetical protein